MSYADTRTIFVTSGGVPMPLLVKAGGERTVLTARVHDRQAADGAASVIVAMSRNGLAFDAPLVGVTEGSYVDAISGETIAVSPARTVMPMAAWQVRVLVPVGDLCAVK